MNNGLPPWGFFRRHVFAMRLLPEAGFFASTQGATEGDQVEFEPWASRFGASGSNRSENSNIGQFEAAK